MVYNRQGVGQPARQMPGQGQPPVLPYTTVTVTTTTTYGVPRQGNMQSHQVNMPVVTPGSTKAANVGNAVLTQNGRQIPGTRAPR